MAQPARRPEPLSGPPPVDPTAIARAYRAERAKRRAREQRRYERKLAALRFVAFVFAILAASVFLSLTIWQEVQRLFGL